VHLRVPRPVTLGATAAVVAVVAFAAGPLTGGAAPSPTAASWTVYHGDPAGDGIAVGVASVDVHSPAWVSPALDGDLYGQPLVLDDRVYVATENDTVDALSATSGKLLWSTHVGTPVPASDLPCGDITPTVGITGTPVIDPDRSELFAVASELVDGSPAHVLVGLDTATGHVELSQRVDPAGSRPAALLQRTGLTLDAGRVVFGMGGNYGDCSTYRGRVMAVPETGGTPDLFTVDAAPDENQGAVWMGGAAPVVDTAGHVWVTTGNGSVVTPSHPYDNSDGVLELSPTLALVQSFAPSSWTTDNANDLDISSAPALLSDGEVVAAGKARIVWLLDGSSLAGIGGAQASVRDACGDDIDGGVAFEGHTVFLPCVRGPIAVTESASPPSLRLAWTATTGGGPPVLAGGLVWTIGQDGTLSGLDPADGAVRARTDVGAPANHFPTPGIGAGLLLAPSARRVTAFAAPSTGSSTPSTTTAPATTPSTSPGGHGGGGRDPTVLVLAIVAGVLAIGVALGLERRRRRVGRVPPGPDAGSTEDHRTVN
jgi:polyvinyl alcohol dehydrogenase (cytochrome)